ncbi:CAMK family protein kinase [Trichomonas vaginalis G3]|uniref:CAMK family protein kinase n=1 Tax=Trichomonas vaginalis (strain ATCC PRA-98 / G3) TaxID=412133 RepID=A2F749_TRIV3|nr:protein serine/threonine kinase protein [Trichomonas vaginalis G3]EAX99286.1 CAMK family protein kinase [Trichomonas vaginalis G3]KAI5524952.1 protein serine/threonine kinase protein [Trichomonas vaginalis G3]|eukprot:XP_001312216.1 CAMK family protein kinase [Trichomonas vaginalis G3]
MEAQVGIYQIFGEIGRGSSGSVHTAKNTQNNQELCVKIIEKSSMNTKEDIEFFRREVSILSALQHKNIAEYHDLLEDSNNYYLFQELCQGENLTKYLENNRPISERQIEIIFHQFCSALSYIHKAGVGHRDLKPDNIIIGANNIVKIIDFGLSTDDNQHLRTTFCGSLAYAAPECIRREPYIAWRSDMWSLGVILFQMNTGRLPWKTSNIVQLMKQITSGNFEIPPSIPAPIKNIIVQCLNQDPTLRPSADDLIGVRFTRPEEPKLPRRSMSPRATVKRTSSNPFFTGAPQYVQPPISPRMNPSPQRRFSQTWIKPLTNLKDASD